MIRRLLIANRGEIARRIIRAAHGLGIEAAAVFSDADVDEARAVWAALADVGVDMDEVAAQLEREGVSSFQKSFDELITALEAKADTV